MQKLHDERPNHSTALPSATDYARVFMTAVTQEDWRRIAARAVEQVRNGDHRAQAWLSQIQKLAGRLPTHAIF